MLKIENLVCGYGRMQVLDNVSLEIGAESVGLFGPNGAGKTTLISAVMGMIKPWKGNIEFEGEKLIGKETFHMARLGIALVPQERELFPWMSVEDNLTLERHIFRMQRIRRPSRWRRCLRFSRF